MIQENEIKTCVDNKRIKRSLRSKDNHVQRNCIKIICIILMLTFAGNDFQVVQAAREKRGVAESFTDGLKYAGQMFGVNTAADVANLVAKAFSNVGTTANSIGNPSFLSGLFQQRKEHLTSTENDEESGHQQISEESADASETQQGESTRQSHHNGTPNTDNFSSPFNSAQLITGVLRMIGFDARKLGALAINAIIMIAQAIGSSLLGTFKRKDYGVNTVDGGRLYMQDDEGAEGAEETAHQPRSLDTDLPLDWFMQSPSKELQGLLNRATNNNLTDELTNMILNAEKSSAGGEHTAACLKLFVCKSSPFIWGMQKSLRQRLEGESDDSQQTDNNFNDRTSIFFKYLPSLDEFRAHGVVCQKRFKALCDATANKK